MDASPVDVRVSQSGQDTKLAEIAALMEASTQSRSQYVRIADRAARLHRHGIEALVVQLDACHMRGRGVLQRRVVLGHHDGGTGKPRHLEVPPPVGELHDLAHRPHHGGNLLVRDTRAGIGRIESDVERVRMRDRRGMHLRQAGRRTRGSRDVATSA